MSAPQPLRKIVHVDMDAFYASVEQRDRPELRGKPVVVGGSPDKRGVVASASYEARKHGIRSAMAASKARRLCPGAIFVRPDFSKYSEASRRIHEIFRAVTDRVEPLSLDEAYLDVTENRMNEPLASRLAVWIKQRIREELGLTASAGVAPNKFLAKLASDFRKPDGLVVVAPEKVAAFLQDLPVERFWGVGPATARKLRGMGFRTAADIRAVSPEQLEAFFGKYGVFLHGLAHGVDEREVENEWQPRSRGAETTFDRDVLALPLLQQTIEELAAEVEESLRKMSRLARTVTLKLRYQDFTTITRSHTSLRPLDDAAGIAFTALDLLVRSTEAGGRPVRLIGVSVSNLIHVDEPLQLWLDLPKVL